MRLVITLLTNMAKTGHKGTSLRSMELVKGDDILLVFDKFPLPVVRFMNIEARVPARRKLHGTKDGGRLLKLYLQFSFIPHSADLALLVLRVWFGASLFLKHGTDKLFAYSAMVARFPDPLHIGTHASLAIALISDGIFSFLVIFGLATRWSALFIFINVLVAWATVVHFQFFGKGVSPGEAMVLYLGGFLAIFLAGPGIFSLDSLFRIDRK